MAETTRQSPTGANRPTPRPQPRPTPPTAAKPPVKPSPKKANGFHGKSPLALVVYGPSGVGKTSLAAYFPKPGFLIDPQEDGITDLTEFGRVPPPVFVQEADTFPGLLDRLEWAATGKWGQIETLVLDSATGFEKLCFHFHCDTYFEGDWTSKGFYSFQQGPKNAAKTDWPRFLDALESVRDRGINVVLLAHSQVKPYSNPEGADYDRFIPYLDKDIWQHTHRWAKAVLFLNYHVEVDKSKGPKAKAKTDHESRFLYTEWSPAFDAKNRYGLAPLIDAGASGEECFHNFEAAFLEAAASGPSS